MLTQLIIKNFALISHLEIQPDERLNIITGETGAGKSIMLGALGLMMGNRADVKSLYNPEEKCIVEGNFAISAYGLKDFFEELELDYEDITIIRREIAPGGKSRAFINDSPVNLEILKNLTTRLIDVHSQHDSILLANSGYQLNLLDSFAGNSELLLSYQNSYKDWLAKEKELKNLSESSIKMQKEFDFNSFLLEELQKAKLSVDEQETAEEELNILEHAEEVKTRLINASGIFNHPEQSLLGMLRDSILQINPIAGYSEHYKSLKERLLSVQIEISDISQELENLESKVEFDEDRIQVLKDRLDLIFKLLSKHGSKDISQLLEIEKELALKVEEVINLDDQLKKLNKQVEEARKEVETKGKFLSESRKKVSKPIETEVVKLLKELGIPNAAFIIEFKPKPAGSEGLDEVEFLFSANKGFDLQPMRKVASGGEFSRLMLSLKYILAQKKALPTIIFDEIDTGISGEVAIKMGNLMSQMAQKMQVLAITHLHQIAGKGNAHYFVYKNDSGGKTISEIRKLIGNERVLEIAKMIGGERPSDSAIQSALELMDKNQN